ncbi:hypothetical protein QM467_04130 [Rhodoblastus sp. 17X3]|uniref:hypothetical protein n=1 Tax=Rhodoblastus sp. 17X3 TaxID=3047026 RepID=UPI0024B7B096|nr:hypothetical protein [Rhodoblastus sp. 17X3]MDI9847248.1 hypothetical protein [Rhodoblastus sp. 17X3]
MSADKDLANNRKGSAVDKFALICAFVSIVCVFGAHGMDKLAQSGALPTFAFDRAGVDYAPTASIRGQAGKVQLNPCGESAKTR